MTLRKLPDIRADGDLARLAFAPDDVALKRWNPAVRAAHEGERNVVSIYDVIGDDGMGGGVGAKRVAAALRTIGDQDVTVNINSPGGDFFEGIAIYNLLREHPRKVTVQAMGLVASAASVIAMAGDEILVSDVGFIMVHNAWGLVIGNRHDMRQAASMLEPFDLAMARLYAARADVGIETAQAWMDAETWFDGPSAIDAGLADALLPSAEVEERQDSEVKSLLAVRRIDAALARQGMPRGERRSLIAAMKGGTPGAAAPAMHDAGIRAALEQLLSTIKA